MRTSFSTNYKGQQEGNLMNASSTSSSWISVQDRERVDGGVKKMD